jgi:hypothetical protein
MTLEIEPKMPDSEATPEEEVGLSEATRAELLKLKREINLETSDAARPGVEAGEAAVANYQKNREAFQEREARKAQEEDLKAKLRQSLNDPSPEGRKRELIERGAWLRAFAERVKSDPSSIHDEEVNTVISYIEQFKNTANKENKDKINSLVQSLRMKLPQTQEGADLLYKASIGFADQYKRLAERQRMAMEGISPEESKAATPFVSQEDKLKPRTTPQPMTGFQLATRKIGNTIRSWFGRGKK